MTFIYQWANLDFDIDVIWQYSCKVTSNMQHLDTEVHASGPKVRNDSKLEMHS